MRRLEVGVEAGRRREAQAEPRRSRVVGVEAEAEAAVEAGRRRESGGRRGA